MPDQPENESLYIVDGTAQLFRAYYAVRGLSTSSGLPTNALFGFTSMLRKLIKDEQPRRLVVTFDTPGEVFRHAAYAKYKANRPPTPEDMNVQSPYARDICRALGVAVLEKQGYEADDIIATYTRIAREAGLDVVIVASDKDLLQLVGDGVTVLNPSKNLRLDAAAVVESFGVEPSQVRDVLGLMGDSVDNIPGVPGVGEKTALAIVSTYGGMDPVVARAERFVSLYDARDAVLAALEEIENSEQVAAAVAAAAADRLDRFRRLLAELIAAEAAKEEIERLDEPGKTAKAAVEHVAAAAGETGKKAIKSLRPLRRALKGMDRGSSRRVWYAINEHVEQARLSKELATLMTDVPAELGLDELSLAEPDRPTALALFSSLEFQAIVAEFEGDAGAAEQPAMAELVAGAYTTLGTLEQLRALVASCREAGRFALHCVAEPDDPQRGRLVGIAFSHAPASGAYLPLGHDYLGAPDQPALDEAVETLRPLFADETVEKVAQDLKRDAHLLRRHGIPASGWLLDTTVAAFLLNSGRPNYALDGLAAEYLGYTATRYDELAGSGAKRIAANQLEVEKVSDWAAEYADVTLRLAADLGSRMETAGLAELYRTMDGPLLPVLARMEARGIRVDTALLERMSGEMDVALEKSTCEIHRLAGHEFNVDSPKQLREVLFEEMGLKPGRKTAKSKVASTDAQTLEELAEEHQIARTILDYRELAKLKGTYVDALPRLVNPETGRVHTCYLPTGAATGRLSSIDPNLQNIPVRSEAGRKIRAAFVAEPGYKFLAADYSQVELRVLAHLAGDAELTKAFRDGEDIHRYTAARVFGTAPDLVTDGMRRRAKAVNFGILYGMSELRLAREQGMKRTEARKFIQTYFERFANVRDYIERTRESALRDAAVRTLFGRVRYFPQLHQKVNRAVTEQALRAAVNTTIQGTAADLMKLAMLHVERDLERAGLDARILLQVHDELLLEVPEDSLEQAGSVVRQAMEQVHELAVPLIVDQKSGDNWYALA